MFLFVPQRLLEDFSIDDPPFTLKHEYGHAMQSAILGPFYLLVIGLPSSIWCNSRVVFKWRLAHNVDYYDFPTEKWANILGDAHKD